MSEENTKKPLPRMTILNPRQGALILADKTRVPAGGFAEVSGEEAAQLMKMGLAKDAAKIAKPLGDAMDALRADVDRLEAENGALKKSPAKSSDLQARIDALTKEKNDLAHSIDIAADSLKRANEAMTALTAENEARKRDAADATARINALEAENASLLEAATKPAQELVPAP